MSRVLPILFNTDMVRAILDGRKTVTRRVVKPQPKSKLCYTFAGCDHGTWTYPADTAHEYWGEEYRLPDCITEEDKKIAWNPPYHTDDILYVRETWQYAYELDGNDQIIEETGRYIYAADNPSPFNVWVMPDGTHRDCMPWRPSIHMPKEAARIWLKVTGIRVERLQDITEEQALKEGAFACTDYDVDPPEKFIAARDIFKNIWDSTVKSDRERYGWYANPYVWVIEFERCEKPESEG